LLKIDPDERADGDADSSDQHDLPGATKVNATKSLAAFLKDKKVTNSQTRKYLATAMWLHEVKKIKRITTSDVTKALSDNNQGKLTNPAQCLINNANRGTIVREGKQFYVTDEGRTECGE
jgi:hypothetical protein